MGTFRVACNCKVTEKLWWIIEIFGYKSLYLDRVKKKQIIDLYRRHHSKPKKGKNKIMSGIIKKEHYKSFYYCAESTAFQPKLSGLRRTGRKTISKRKRARIIKKRKKPQNRFTKKMFFDKIMKHLNKKIDESHQRSNYYKTFKGKKPEPLTFLKQKTKPIKG